MTDDVKKHYCNKCHQNTMHELIHEDDIDVTNSYGLDSIKKIFIVTCRGCKEYTIVEELWHASESLDEGRGAKLATIKYKPARIWHKPPDWLSQLDAIDTDLKTLLDEIYSATNNQQLRLLSMGVRAALDKVMTIILEGDIGTFEHKLKEMVQKERFTKGQAESIRIVIDAGSASTHRGFKPPIDLIKEMVVVMENIVREYYITGPMLKTAKQQIPPRPNTKSQQ